jgi:RNA polymerase sigma-70 factor (ECF subfamily)
MTKSEHSDRDKLSFYSDLYTQYRDEFIYWIRKRYNISDEDAKDIFQESVLILRDKVVKDEYDNSRASVKTFLFGIGKNLCLSMLRKQKPMVNLSIDSSMLEEQDELYDHEKDERLNLVLSLIDKMKGKCKQLIMLYYVEKRKMDFIAKALELKNADTAKATKNRCMKTLRDQAMESTKSMRQ